MEDDRPSAAHVDHEEAEEDALPDWTQFAKFAKTNADKGTLSNAVPFIPKRGEKDFEPLPASSAFPPTSKEATLSTYQQNTLQASRNALYTALSTGSRQHSSRHHNSFTWRPELARATCDNGIATYGIHFGSIGHFHVDRKQVELLPEEALYMNERGAIELWKETAEGARVPMSVQQAWAELIGHDELTPERYQVYAFLKRLGYTLVRARPIPGTEKPPPDRPFSLYYETRDLLHARYHALRNAIAQLVQAARKLIANTLANHVRLVATRAVGGREGRFVSLVAGRRWANYDQIFSKLQIIPTGHDAPLPRPTLAQTPSVLTPLTPSPEPSHTLTPPAMSQEPKRELQDLEAYPYQPFFHMYKPITKYKKSAPPPPDFRIVVVNGATTPMPTLFEFTDMFDSVPFPTENTLLPPPPVQRAPASGPAPKPPRPPRAPNPNAPKAAPPTPTRLQSILSKVPLVATYFPSLVTPTASKKKPPPKKQPSPYPRLKTGRRSILVAVVSDGTSSILRFSESEFAKLPWKGQARYA
ncbi:tRNA splicing endonuclease subunit SEN54 [Sporobolomyces koalae]|uniref:tRNA splicing endonuclease subunit SEN54 n=1 Tax=Sporobolomyces koalae TaxID=500713 RepID=UPI00316DC9D0